MAAPVPRFDQRIENLAGVIHSDTEAVKQWLVDGCHDVVRKIRAIFLNAAEEGRVHLFQRRITRPAEYHKPAFEYWSTPVSPK